MMDGLANVEVVILGSGRMGSALAVGLVESGRIAGAKMVCLDADAARAEALAARVGARTDLGAAQGPRVWVVAVKPGDVVGAMRAVERHFQPEDTLVSIAAGLRLDYLRALAGPRPRLVRAMPNTPALVGRGVTGVMAETADTEALAVALFKSVGRVVVLQKEDDFDALTALSGSGPAYIFVAIEALADAGVLCGLSRDVARELAVQTVAGAAALVEADPTTHTAELKDRVASPAGTTIHALAALEAHGFRHALIAAVQAAARQSRKMSGDDDQR